MRVVKGQPQCSYEHGENMCSTAALCMCVAMVSQEACQNVGMLLEHVMGVASNVHQRFKKKSIHQLASVADIVKHMDLEDFMHNTGFHEYIICEGGSTEMNVSCMISRTLFTQCLASHSLGGGVVAAVLTCNGHSVAVSRKHEEYSLFDSAPSFLMVEMNETQFDEKMNEIIVGQCDVTVLYAQASKK
jgi:hypothetical protein